MDQAKGKSRGAEGPFGRGVQRRQRLLWWGPGAKPLVAAGETGGVQRGQRPLWRFSFQKKHLQFLRNSIIIGVFTRKGTAQGGNLSELEDGGSPAVEALRKSTWSEAA